MTGRTNYAQFAHVIPAYHTQWVYTKLEIYCSDSIAKLHAWCIVRSRCCRIKEKIWKTNYRHDRPSVLVQIETMAKCYFYHSFFGGLTCTILVWQTNSIEDVLMVFSSSCKLQTKNPDDAET